MTEHASANQLKTRMRSFRDQWCWEEQLTEISANFSLPHPKWDGERRQGDCLRLHSLELGHEKKNLKKQKTPLKRMNKNKCFTCLDLSEIFIKFPVLFSWTGWRFVVWREWLLDFSMVEIHHILWGLKSESKASYWIAESSVSFHSTSKNKVKR